MENNQDKSIFNFSTNEETTAQLKGISLWAKINVVIAFIALVLSLLKSIIFAMKMGAYYYYSMSNNFFGNKQTIIWWISTLVVNIILLSASKNIQIALKFSNQDAFNKGLSNLARYFAILGISTIILLLLSFFMVLFYSYFWSSYSRF